MDTAAREPEAAVHPGRHETHDITTRSHRHQDTLRLLRLAADGYVWFALQQRWTDGTTRLPFDPIELLERLAALTPRPRINLILHHAVLAPRAAWGSLVIGEPADRDDTTVADAPPDQADSLPARSRGATSQLWADLMRRSLGFDVLACPIVNRSLSLRRLACLLLLEPSASWPSVVRE